MSVFIGKNQPIGTAQVNRVSVLTGKHRPIGMAQIIHDDENNALIATGWLLSSFLPLVVFCCERLSQPAVFSIACCGDACLAQGQPVSLHLMRYCWFAL